LASELHEARLEAVTACLLASGASSVLDLGCGTGELMARLAGEPQFVRILGIDICDDALGEARALLGLDPFGAEGRLGVRHASFCEVDGGLRGFDAAVMLETIEHVEPSRLSLVERAVFGSYRPTTVVITTPNSEYNPLHGLLPGAMRHPGHRFEWTRRKFREWAAGVGSRQGYSTTHASIGPPDPSLGSSTQMAVFKRLPSP